MELDTTMIVAGITALFAVSLLFFSLLISGESGGGPMREREEE